MFGRLGRRLGVMLLVLGAALPTGLGPSAAADDSAGVACSQPVTRGAYTGYRICDSSVLDFTHPNGIRETFVVGTPETNNVYHIWQRYGGDTRWTGWQRVPGNGTAVTGVFRMNTSPLVIGVSGTTGLIYCNRHGSSWSGWYRC